MLPTGPLRPLTFTKRITSCNTTIFCWDLKLECMETGDFSTIESMSFAFTVSGFDVVADQCVLVWRDIDVNQDFSAAVQPQATTTLS